MSTTKRALKAYIRELETMLKETTAKFERHGILAREERDVLWARSEQLDEVLAELEEIRNEAEQYKLAMLKHGETVLSRDVLIQVLKERLEEQTVRTAELLEEAKYHDAVIAGLKQDNERLHITLMGG